MALAAYNSIKESLQHMEIPIPVFLTLLILEKGGVGSESGVSPPQRVWRGAGGSQQSCRDAVAMAFCNPTTGTGYVWLDSSSDRLDLCGLGLP